MLRENQCAQFITHLPFFLFIFHFLYVLYTTTSPFLSFIFFASQYYSVALVNTLLFLKKYCTTIRTEASSRLLYSVDDGERKVVTPFWLKEIGISLSAFAAAEEENPANPATTLMMIIMATVILVYLVCLLYRPFFKKFLAVSVQCTLVAYLFIHYLSIFCMFMWTWDCLRPAFFFLVLFILLL